jgi:hypothetical protein
MLEIFLIIAISKKIAAMLKEKGRSAAGYVILFVVMWFGGEIVGAVIGAIVTIAADPNPNAMNAGFPWMAYVMALVGAAIGGGIGYAIAAAVPAIEKPDSPRRRARFDDDDEDDEDEYERERARRRRRRAASADDDGKFEEDRSGH